MRLIYNFLFFVLIHVQIIGMDNYKCAHAKIKKGDNYAIQGFVQSYKQEFDNKLEAGITAGELRAHIQELKLLCAATQKAEDRFKSYVNPSLGVRFAWLGALGLRAGFLCGTEKMTISLLSPYILKNGLKAYQLTKGILSAATREAARQAAAEHGTTYFALTRDFFAIPLFKYVSACLVGVYAIKKMTGVAVNYVKPAVHFTLLKSKRQEEFVKRQSINQSMKSLEELLLDKKIETVDLDRPTYTLKNITSFWMSLDDTIKVKYALPLEVAEKLT